MSASGGRSFVLHGSGSEGRRENEEGVVEGDEEEEGEAMAARSGGELEFELELVVALEHAFGLAFAWVCA
jgi:hypothetical protein